MSVFRTAGISMMVLLNAITVRAQGDAVAKPLMHRGSSLAGFVVGVPSGLGLDIFFADVAAMRLTSLLLVSTARARVFILRDNASPYISGGINHTIGSIHGTGGEGFIAELALGIQGDATNVYGTVELRYPIAITPHVSIWPVTYIDVAIGIRLSSNPNRT